MVCGGFGGFRARHRVGLATAALVARLAPDLLTVTLLSDDLETLVVTEADDYIDAQICLPTLLTTENAVLRPLG
jgi:hypothetical protein